MEGPILTKAMEWFDRAIKMDQEKKDTMRDKCLDKAIELEKEGLAKGESWSK
jgi:hypothetical protein